MMDMSQLIQMLQNLHQKNGQQDAPPMMQNNAVQPQAMAGAGKGAGNGISMLGVLGGLGDTRNAQGNIDPSWLTQMNQGIMRQTGQQGLGNQNLPWLPQTGGQQIGHGIMSFLSGLL